MIKRDNFRFCLIIIFGFIFAITLASGEIKVNDAEIKNSYFGGEPLSGNIELTIKNQPSNTLVKTSFNENITLIELLRKNKFEQNSEYNCTSNRCVSFYSKGGGETNSFSLDGKKEVGFYIEGEEVLINRIDFSVDSDVPSSCYSPLIIKPLNGEYVYPTSYDLNSVPCSEKIYGCFEEGLSTSKYKKLTLSKNYYCNNVVLEPAPAFKLNAILTASDNKTQVKMSLFGEDLEPYGDCLFYPSSNGQINQGCIVNHSITKEGNYSICVSTKSSTIEYEIRYEKENKVCGGAGAGESDGGDYEIYASALPYSGINDVSISEMMMRTYGLDFTDESNRYIQDIYSGDCSNGCVLPIIFEGNSQKIDLKNISITYDFEGNLANEKNVYEIEKKSPLVSSNGKLDINLKETGFKVPVIPETNRFKLWIGNELVIDKILNITRGFNFEVYPNRALIGIENYFYIITQYNVTNANWDFGDGEKKETFDKFALHKYSSPGNYTIKVSAVNNKGEKGSKEIEVIAGDANASAFQLINLSQKKVDKIEREISLINPFLKERVMSIISIEDIKKKMAEVKSEYSLAKDEEDYVKIINGINELKIPSRVFTSDAGSSPIEVGFSSIQSDYAQIITNQEIPEDKKEEFKLNIIEWNYRQAKPEVNFETVSFVDSEGKINNIATYYKVKLNINKDSEAKYLIIDYPSEKIRTKDGRIYNISTLSSSGSYIDIEGKSEIEFSIDDKNNIESLGMHLAPSKLESIGIYSTHEPFDPAKIPKGWLISWISLLILFFFASYIALQEWYKKRYEKYLFGNPDDLYNIITFIHNARESGIADEQSRKSLKNSGWSWEQVSYTYKKIDGKRTGMFEIPIFSSREKRIIREEIQKRRGNKPDVRFIKRPSF